MVDVITVQRRSRKSTLLHPLIQKNLFVLPSVSQREGRRGGPGKRKEKTSVTNVLKGNATHLKISHVIPALQDSSVVVRKYSLEARNQRENVSICDVTRMSNMGLLRRR